MDLGNIKRRKTNKKSILISIRITPELSKWLKEKDYSPTGIFYEALKELGWEEKNE